MRRSQRRGFRANEAAILAYLGRYGSAGAAELAEFLNLSPSRVRVVIMRMRPRLTGVRIVARKRVAYQLETRNNENHLDRRAV